MRTAFLGTSEFAAAVLRTLAGSRHRPALVVTPPDSRRGRGRQELPPPAAEAAREVGIELAQTADVNAEPELERIRAARPEARRRLRLRAADPRAAPERAAVDQRPPVAAAPLARRGADRAGDHGRGRADRRQRDETDRGPRLGPGRASVRRSRSAPTTTSRPSRAASRRSAPGCWSGASTCSRPAISTSRTRTTPRRPTPRRSTPPSGASIPPARRSSWPERSAP